MTQNIFNKNFDRRVDLAHAVSESYGLKTYMIFGTNGFISKMYKNTTLSAVEQVAEKMATDTAGVEFYVTQVIVSKSTKNAVTTKKF